MNHQSPYHNSHPNSPMVNVNSPQPSTINQPATNSPMNETLFPNMDDPIFQQDANIMSANFKSAASKVYNLFKEAQAQQIRSYQLGYEQCLKDLSHHLVQTIQRQYEQNYNGSEFNPMQANIPISEIEAYCRHRINSLKSAAMSSPGFGNNNTELDPMGDSFRFESNSRGNMNNQNNNNSSSRQQF